MVNRKRLYRENGRAYHSNDQGVDGKLWVAVTSSVDLVIIGSGLGPKAWPHLKNQASRLYGFSGEQDITMSNLGNEAEILFLFLLVMCHKYME